MIERKPVDPERIVVGRAVHPVDAAPSRLDKLVTALFPELPTRAGARKACERGEVAVDGLLSESSRWVAPGSEVVLFASERRPPKPLARPIHVVVEDDWLAVVYKPAGLPTSGAFANTLERALPANLRPSDAADAMPAPRVVHRLDGPTAGLVIVAKTRAAHAGLGQQFEQRQVDKRYRALALGRLGEPGVPVMVDAPVDDRPAVTRIVPVLHTRTLRTTWLTTVDAAPETGRTHQIRRHLAALGHPVLGDTHYGVQGAILYGHGLYLAAVHIGFTHPITGAPVVADAPEPPKFAGFRAREERRFARWHADRLAQRPEP